MSIFDGLAVEWQKMTHHGASQAPEAIPATVRTAKTQGGPVSIASDAEQGYQAVKDEMAKFEQALPGVLEQARKAEASPFADVAERAAMASGFLPAEAIAIAVKAAGNVIDDLINLYAPAQAAQAPAAAQ